MGEEGDADVSVNEQINELTIIMDIIITIIMDIIITVIMDWIGMKN